MRKRIVYFAYSFCLTFNICMLQAEEQPSKTPQPTERKADTANDEAQLQLLAQQRQSKLLRNAEGAVFAIPEDAEQHVSVVLQIDGSADAMIYGGFPRPDVQAVSSLLSSTAIVDAALAKSLKLNPKQRQESVIVTAIPAGPRFTKLDVVLRKSGQEWKSDAANQLMAALCQQVKAAYEESAHVTAKRLKVEVEQLEEQREAIRKKLTEIRAKVQSAQDAIGLFDGGDLNFQLRNLRNQKSSSERELDRVKSRLASLKEASDARGSEWGQVVKLREKKVAELKEQVKVEKASPDVLADAELKLAEARAQLESSRRQSDPNDQNRLIRENEAQQLRAQLAEIESRLNPVLDALSKFEKPETRELLTSYPDFRQQEQNLNNELNEIGNRITQSQRNLRITPKVVVTVLDGVPDDESN